MSDTLSWPSRHKFGVMNARFGVCATVRKIAVKLCKGHDVFSARGMIDYRVKVDKRVVSRCVLSLSARVDVTIESSEDWVLTVYAHVFHVSLPGQALVDELVRNCSNGLWINAPSTSA
jgi:hypothetical protein